MCFPGIPSPSNIVGVCFEEILTTKAGVTVSHEGFLNAIFIPCRHHSGGEMYVSMVRAMTKTFVSLTEECGRARPNPGCHADECVVADLVQHRSRPLDARAVIFLLVGAAVPSQHVLGWRV